MPIVQISRIQHRRGKQENLPNLAGGELGWATDSRRLFIGNGTAEDSAPADGVTEVLTQFSDLTALVNNSGTNLTLIENSNPTRTDLVINKDVSNSAVIEYVVQRSDDIRSGTLKVVFLGYKKTYSDDFIETADLGIELSFDINESSSAVLCYTATPGPAATLTYNIKSSLKVGG